MRSRHLLVFFFLSGIALPATAAPAEQLTPEERGKLTARLRLLEIDTRQTLKTYERETQREADLRGSIKALNRQADERLDSYTQALRVTQEAIDQAKQKLVELETERFRILGRLGKQEAEEPVGRADPTLEKILDVIIKMEKRLETLERRPVPPRR